MKKSMYIISGLILLFTCLSVVNTIIIYFMMASEYGMSPMSFLWSQGGFSEIFNTLILGVGLGGVCFGIGSIESISFLKDESLVVKNEEKVDVSVDADLDKDSANRLEIDENLVYEDDDDMSSPIGVVTLTSKSTFDTGVMEEVSLDEIDMSQFENMVVTAAKDAIATLDSVEEVDEEADREEILCNDYMAEVFFADWIENPVWELEDEVEVIQPENDEIVDLSKDED